MVFCLLSHTHTWYVGKSRVICLQNALAFFPLVLGLPPWATVSSPGSLVPFFRAPSPGIVCSPFSSQGGLRSLSVGPPHPGSCRGPPEHGCRPGSSRRGGPVPRSPLLAQPHPPLAVLRPLLRSPRGSQPAWGAPLRNAAPPLVAYLANPWPPPGRCLTIQTFSCLGPRGLLTQLCCGPKFCLIDWLQMSQEQYILTAALFTTAKMWKQPNCPWTDGWRGGTHTHTHTHTHACWNATQP